MKIKPQSITLWLFVSLAGFFLAGCSEDIQIIEPGSPYPVVYAVFDLNQPVHYVKVSKTFAGEADPYTLALNHDQIFYSDAQVFINQATGGIRIPFTLEKNLPRSQGLFPALPNEAFVLNKKLQPGNYQLTVILPETKDTLTAPFAFINTFKVITPKAGFKRFYFYEDPILFSWFSDPAAGMYEIALTLKYEEMLKSGVSRIKSASFTRQLEPFELEADQDRYSYRFFSDSFFAFLGTNIAKNDSVDYRKPISLELLMTAADTTLARYLNWFNLEIDDKINPNGNVKGAIGVVGTKYSIPFPDLIPSLRSQDSLVRGKYTRKLGFVNNPDW